MSTSDKRPARPAAAVYVPRHRRMTPQAQEEVAGSVSDIPPDEPPSTPKAANGDSSSNTPPTRRGRGQFKSPTIKNSNEHATRQEQRRRPPVRVYPPAKRSPESTIDSSREKGTSTAESSRTRSAKSGDSTPELMVNTVDQLSTGLSDVSITRNGDGDSEVGSDQPLDDVVQKNDEEAGSDSEEEWEKEPEPDLQPPNTKTREATKSNRNPSSVGDFTEDITTVLDVYDFPTSFKTHDLELIFEGFDRRRGGFTIKWMSDTRALIVFQHPDTAKAAYAHALGNPFIRVKPYAGEIERDDRPRVPAPVKSDIVARRLVAGALGMRSPRKSADEAAADKRKLQDAKDKIAAEKNQRALREAQIQAAWDA
ncbi:hypothetical protein DFJ77DRAFT_456828 [Powellomyces hirtus]|nr:hypothetical protein DFJ77DRAFT_456828 [Powellomyces hirtus]